MLVPALKVLGYCQSSVARTGRITFCAKPAEVVSLSAVASAVACRTLGRCGRLRSHATWALAGLETNECKIIVPS
jgi:hypothetical protein